MFSGFRKKLLNEKSPDKNKPRQKIHLRSNTHHCELINQDINKTEYTERFSFIKHITWNKFVKCSNKRSERPLLSLSFRNCKLYKQTFFCL